MPNLPWPSPSRRRCWLALITVAALVAAFLAIISLLPNPAAFDAAATATAQSDGSDDCQLKLDLQGEDGAGETVNIHLYFDPANCGPTDPNRHITVALPGAMDLSALVKDDVSIVAGGSRYHPGWIDPIAIPRTTPSPTTLSNYPPAPAGKTPPANRPSAPTSPLTDSALRWTTCTCPSSRPPSANPIRFPSSGNLMTIPSANGPPTLSFTPTSTSSAATTVASTTAKSSPPASPSLCSTTAANCLPTAASPSAPASVSTPPCCWPTPTAKSPRPSSPG